MFTLTITGRPLYIIALYRHTYFTQKLFMRNRKDVQCQVKSLSHLKNGGTNIILRDPRTGRGPAKLLKNGPGRITDQEKIENADRLAVHGSLIIPG